VKRSELNFLNSILDTHEETLKSDGPSMDGYTKMEALCELDEVVEVLEQEYKRLTSEKVVQLY
jgi:hypothetical protein